MSATTRYILIGLFVLILAVGATYIVGLRIFVITPRAGIEDGYAAVIHGSDFLMPVDSPEAVCRRWRARPDLECVRRAITEVNAGGRVLLVVPYFAVLGHLSGGSDQTY